MSNLKDRSKRDNLIGGITLLLTFPIWIPIALVVIAFTFNGLYRIFFNNTSVWNSEFVGREVKIAPFATISKMIKIGGWRDRYCWLFAKNSEALNQNTLNEVGGYKVTSEKRNIGSSERICIIENAKIKEQPISINCDFIPKINELTSVYMKLLNDVKSSGKAYVASAYSNSDLTPVLKVNKFKIYELKTEEDIKKAMVSNSDKMELYESVMDLKQLIYFKKNELFNEISLSKLLNHNFGAYWNNNIYEYVELEKYVEENKAAPEMEKWLMENIPISKDRWAIRTILSIVQQGIRLHGHMDEHRATEFIKGLEESKLCVSNYYSDRNKTASDIELALKKYFEKGDRQVIFNSLKRKMDSSYNSNIKPCDQFYPPTLCNGKENCG